MPVYENTKFILEKIGSTTLVCITKTIEPERINEAIRAGATIIGENWVQEYEDKRDDLLPCETHLTGHLQAKKVKKAAHLFDVIQSIDSLKLIRNIDRRARDIGKVQRVYLQVNIGNEPQKYGFRLHEIKNAIKEIRSLRNVRVEGLMCIPPFVPPEQTRSYFRKMKALFDEMKQENRDNIDIRTLSMGMSSDYRIAIEEGATMIRVGSAIFGKRKY
ncbi:YggS family pyridoxal phosphate-dependent enzyme [Methanosarcina sp. DH2]|uniref:YggS family pyridoxal phosphate-dependent enzyme n=1 Tax=Methanosarcina sp. DH2 TaxID=2605639 RepID=UPI001E3131AC|nr:YggS family pyridoxal phosphate-dependent enzyme [Methanosarcina sp. DH2]MCC4770846.1 YggS family pyridoxal phosphate-dependent enzyme [Methanosarcina sp. DH2]